MFNIDPSSGEVVLINSGNIENNSYFTVNVNVSDGQATVTQSIMIFVDNIEIIPGYYTTSNFNINNLDLNKIYDTFHHNNEILIYGQDDTLQNKLIKLNENGETIYDLNIDPHPNYSNSTFSNSDYGILNNNEISRNL